MPDLPFLKNASLDAMPCRFGAQACGRGGGRERLCSGSRAGSPGMGWEIGKASLIRALIFPLQPVATRIRGQGWDGPLAELGLQVGPKPAQGWVHPQLLRCGTESGITAPGRDQGFPRRDRPLRLPGRDRGTIESQTLCASPPKLLAEGDLSHEPVYFPNKSPFKAGKSQTESVRYPNVALS